MGRLVYSKSALVILSVIGRMGPQSCNGGFDRLCFTNVLLYVWTFLHSFRPQACPPSTLPLIILYPDLAGWEDYKRSFSRVQIFCRLFLYTVTPRLGLSTFEESPFVILIPHGANLFSLEKSIEIYH